MEWPFVGRDSEIASAVDWLRRDDGNVLVLLGDPGVGKSRLAREIVVAMAPDSEPLIYHGFETCVHRQYVPFARIAATDPPATPRVVADCLKRGVGDASVLVFDDTQWYDHDSADAASLYIADGWSPAIITARADSALPQPFADLLTTDFVSTIVVGGLDRASIATAAEHALGGILLGSSVDLLHQASAGNPLLAAEILSAATADGALRRSGTSWVLDRIPVTASHRVDELIDRHLNTLDPARISVLEALAVCEPAPTTFARTLLGDQWEPIVASDLVVVDHDVVRFSHPLVSASLRTNRTLIRRYAALRRLLAADEVQRYDDRSSVVAWRLELGGDVSLDELTNVTNRAVQTGDVRAERFARAAIERGGGIAAKLQLVAALRAIGSPERFEIINESLVHEARPGPERLVTLLNVAGQIAHHENDLDRALAMIDLGETLEPGEFNAAAFAAARMQFLTAFDHDVDALPHALAAAEATTNPFAQAAAFETLVGLLLALGSPEEALRRAREADDLDDACFAFIGRTRATLESNRVNALLALGHIDEALERATADLRHFRDDGLNHNHYQALAAAFGERGDLESAIAEAARLVEVTDERAVGERGFDDAWVARLHAIRGDAAEAQRFVDRYERVGWTPGRASEASARLHLAVLTDAPIDVDSIVAASTAWSEASRQALAELRLLFDLARLDLATDDHAMRASDLATRLDFEWAHAHADAVRAASTREPDALVEIAARFGGAGCFGYAADFAAASARAVPSGRRPAFATEARRLREHHLARAPGWVVLADAPADRSQGVLTQRERAVAERVASGMSARACAEELAISPRTVTNLLQRCYDKLGVNSRDALADAVRVNPTRP